MQRAGRAVVSLTRGSKLHGFHMSVAQLHLQLPHGNHMVLVLLSPPAPSGHWGALLSAAELNFLVFRYLQESARIMDVKEKAKSTSGPPPPRLDCMKCFDALWFCYSPFHQMQSYYRYGEFDNCFGKWGDLVDCLTLKTKRAAEVEEILIAQEKAKPHIWTFRTVDEASQHWWRMYRHVAIMSTPVPRAAQQPPKSIKS